jgi:hypothetical protein
MDDDSLRDQIEKLVTEERRPLDRLDPAERAVCAAALEELHRVVDAENPDPHHRLPL